MLTEKAPVQEASNETVRADLRKKKLVRKQTQTSALKYHLWLAGHALAVVFGLVAIVWQAFWLKNVYYIGSISYRLSLLGTVLALGATMSKQFGLHFLPPLTTLLAQHNFQYLVLAVTWMFTFKLVFKLIPTVLISLLQLAAHKKVSFVENQADFLGSIIAFDEVLLVGYLLLRTLLFRSTSGFQLTIMLILLWLRILFDPNTAQMFGYLVDKLDGKMSTQKNEKVLKVWGKIKLFLREKQNPGLYKD